MGQGIVSTKDPTDRSDRSDLLLLPQFPVNFRAVSCFSLLKKSGTGVFILFRGEEFIDIEGGQIPDFAGVLLDRAVR